MKIYKKIILSLFTFFILTWSIPTNAISPLNGKAMGADDTESFAQGAGFTEYNGANGVVDIINIALTGFLSMMGIVFIILLVMAGYKYMTAQGEEKNVTEALNSIKRAVIGLIIVISAYSITYFVFSNLPGGRSGGSTDSGSVGTPSTN